MGGAAKREDEGSLGALNQGKTHSAFLMGDGLGFLMTTNYSN